jgi:hypothetical protein
MTSICLLVFIYILRVGLIDIFFSVTSCRFLFDDSQQVTLFEFIRDYMGMVTDALDFIMAYILLFLFTHYVKR